MLIDGGEKSPGVIAYLKNYVEGNLEAVVATHPHADHIGGLIDVLQSYQVDKIFWNGETATTKTYTDFMALTKAEPNSSLQQLKRGDSLAISGLSFSVLNPPNPLFGDANNNSIVIKLRYGDIQFLFSGDAEQEAEASMLSAGLSIDSDILKVGHHGSRTASSPSFVKAISPNIALYLAGQGNSYGHPHPESIATLKDFGATIYGTDLHGSIVLSCDGKKYETKTGIPAPQVSRPSIIPSPTPTQSAIPTQSKSAPTFIVSDLTISPNLVDVGQTSTLSVSVSNTGDLTGTYEVILKVNNNVMSTKTISLAGHETQKVTFAVITSSSGNYLVDINGLYGALTAKSVSPTTTYTVPTTTYSVPTTKSDTVYITRTGAKYHRGSCRYLSQSSIPIERSVAINRGYTPCSVCRP